VKPTEIQGGLRRRVLALLTPIEREAAGCQKCKISLTRTHSVFGKGNPLAQLVLLGEGPGQDEDHEGMPFRGKAGKLLHRALETIGYDETNTYFCNILKCRACDITDSGWAKNRTPDSLEISNCAPFLRRQLEALPNKKLIFAVGSTAMHWLLSADPASLRIGTVRGKFLVTDYEDVLGLATYHPSYLLREENAEIKAQVYEDFKLARDYLAGAKGGLHELILKAKHDFEWTGSKDSGPLPRPKAAVEEEKKTQRPGRLLENQKDRYTAAIEVWGEGGSVTTEDAPTPSKKPVFGVKPAKSAKQAAPTPLFAEVLDDDVPF
jgi:uracil-DNA glycosylase